MEDINLHNYEEFLLDYSEGVLTDEQICNLELFVMLNPNLAIDLHDLELVKITDDELNYYEKNNLKKTNSDLISENQFIGYIEKQLSDLEINHIEKSCALNNSLAKELNLYKNTCLVADETIIYPSPNILKRKPKVIWYNFSISKFAAAASIVLLLGIFFVWRNYNTDVKLKEVISLTEINKDENINEFKQSRKNDNSFIVKQNKTNLKYNKVPVATNSLNKNVIYKALKKSNKMNLLTDSNKTELAVSIKNIDEATNNTNDISILKKETVISESVVSVISENDTPELTSFQRKKGIWAIACNALSKLNKLGLKAVNGSDNENTGYALNFGRLSVKHSAATAN